MKRSAGSTASEVGDTSTTELHEINELTVREVGKLVQCESVCRAAAVVRANEIEVICKNLKSLDKLGASGDFDLELLDPVDEGLLVEFADVKVLSAHGRKEGGRQEKGAAKHFIREIKIRNGGVS